MTHKVPMMTATTKADNKGFVNPKEHVHTTEMNTQADKDATTTKVIVGCFGRVHDSKMQQLALSGKESTSAENVSSRWHKCNQKRQSHLGQAM